MTGRALELGHDFLERIDVRAGRQHFELGGVCGIGGRENSDAKDQAANLMNQ